MIEKKSITVRMYTILFRGKFIMSKSDDAAGLAVLIGGAIGLGLLYLLSKGQTQQPIVYRCPQCKNQIQKGTLSCPYCYTSLKWV